jgi:hypothetical protein
MPAADEKERKEDQKIRRSKEGVWVWVASNPSPFLIF